MSEEPDDEDSIQEDAIMDEHEILSERSAAAEEEEQRSLQGDMEIDNATQLPFLRPDQESIQQQNKLIIKIAKLNYHNLMLIQEGQHTTTFTTTTTTKSSTCGSESFHMRTVKTVITEDQMSTCSCCKKSRRPPSDYNGSIAPSFKSYNRSHLP